VDNGGFNSSMQAMTAVVVAGVGLVLGGMVLPLQDRTQEAQKMRRFGWSRRPSR
jgi:hypothetical protein